MATTKSYALSKKRVREMITEKFGDADTISTTELMDLFASGTAGNSTGESTIAIDEDGEIIGKRCSYFGVYMDISEFGTMGTDDEGNVKYGYQSKPAQKCIRLRKADADKMKDELDKNLDETGDLDAWREAKSELAEYESAKCEVPEELETTETLEDFLEIN